MTDLSRVVSTPVDFLRLQPPELGGIILEMLNRPPSAGELPQNLHYQNLRYEHPDLSIPGRGHQLQEEIWQAMVEAWQWLLHEGFLAPQTGQNGQSGFVFVTRKGKQYQSTFDVQNYLRARDLPLNMLHPAIQDQVWNMFFRGEHDTAVFQAFKQVEIAVREAGGYAPEDVGVSLMRKAFHQETEPLTDTNKPIAEREALMHLFAGAIGSYKNPQSHRHVGIPTAEEAAEMIILASHLLRIVDTRRQS